MPLSLQSLIDIRALETNLEYQFHQGEPVASLLKAKSDWVDHCILAWGNQNPNVLKQCCLIALGGYGRQALHPHSDIDLLILHTPKANIPDCFTSLFNYFWDSKLHLSQSVRTLEDCLGNMNNLQFFTALLDARFLIGNESIFNDLKIQLSQQRYWTQHSFLKEKLNEAKERHQKYGGTALTLEPDLKNSPGGLRDIQLVELLMNFCLGISDFHQLSEKGHLAKSDPNFLTDCKHTLNHWRYALHLLNKKPTERLSIDTQINLAEILGYKGSSPNQSVELMMKFFFSQSKTLMRIIQHLSTIIEEQESQKIYTVEAQTINHNFYTIDKRLEVKHPDFFSHEPEHLLEAFYILCQHPFLKGFGSKTLLAIKDALPKITNQSYKKLKFQKYFLKILNHPSGMMRTLELMNLLGVLGRYIPSFHPIEGLMQFDLFHAYTVDTHTLKVIYYLNEFQVNQQSLEFNDCHTIFQRVEKPLILTLAALFHDIGKGQGGDHSQIGAKQARTFCRYHRLKPQEIQLITWLVENHLVMSHTAQHQDISDLRIINQFAEHVKTPRYLDHLYLLTMSDIRATNPTLWNSWKYTLLQTLYLRTRERLSNYIAPPKKQSERVKIIKKQLIQWATKNKIMTDTLSQNWELLHHEYFLVYSLNTLQWQTQLISKHDITKNHVFIYSEPMHPATQLLVTAENANNSFSIVTESLEKMNLNVVSAQCFLTTTNTSFETYCFLDRKGAPIQNLDFLTRIKNKLLKQIILNTRSQSEFHRPTAVYTAFLGHPILVHYENDFNLQRTLLHLSASDSPGILAAIAMAFQECNVRLQAAKINTLGDKIDNVFFIRNKEESLLNEAEQSELKETLELRLKKCLLNQLSKEEHDD